MISTLFTVALALYCAPSSCAATSRCKCVSISPQCQLRHANALLTASRALKTRAGHQQLNGER